MRMALERVDQNAARQVRWRMAALRLDVKLLRLRLILKRYNSNQPRLPADGPDGGQWTSGGGQGSADTDRTQVAQNDTQRRYSIDLAEEEARGGHAIDRHVGKSDEELLAVVTQQRYSLPGVTIGRKRHGSFASREAADYVNRTLERNRATVDAVASGSEPEAFIKERFGHETGREAFMPEDGSAPYVRKTYGIGVLVYHERRSPRGCRVHTAYPRNDQVVHADSKRIQQTMRAFLSGHRLGCLERV